MISDSGKRTQYKFGKVQPETATQVVQEWETEGGGEAHLSARRKFYMKPLKK